MAEEVTEFIKPPRRRPRKKAEWEIGLDVLDDHHPQVCHGVFLCCSCGWEHDEGYGDEWVDHIRSVR